MAKQYRNTLADYVVIGFSPVLLVGLLVCLVWFLMEMIYSGRAYLSATAALWQLKYILFWFVLAVVLISRISLQGNTPAAMMYGIVLALVVTFATLKFVDIPTEGPLGRLGLLVPPALLALTWVCAHWITKDCTYISEDDQDESANVGVMDLWEDKRTKPLEAGSKEEKTRWMSDYQKERATERRKHAPGTLLVWFSLAALPLFGLGQALIPAGDDRRRYVLWLLIGYVGCGLGLLLTTSFLGLRRYMHLRKLRMPRSMTGTWLGIGAATVIVLLLVGALLPRPDGVMDSKKAFAWLEWLWPSKEENDVDEDASDASMMEGQAGKGEGGGQGDPNSQGEQERQGGQGGQIDPKGGGQIQGGQGQGGQGGKGQGGQGNQQGGNQQGGSQQGNQQGGNQQGNQGGSQQGGNQQGGNQQGGNQQGGSQQGGNQQGGSQQGGSQQGNQQGGNQQGGNQQGNQQGGNQQGGNQQQGNPQGGQQNQGNQQGGNQQGGQPQGGQGQPVMPHNPNDPNDPRNKKDEQQNRQDRRPGGGADQSQERRGGSGSPRSQGGQRKTTKKTSTTTVKKPSLPSITEGVMWIVLIICLVIAAILFRKQIFAFFQALWNDWRAWFRGWFRTPILATSSIQLKEENPPKPFSSFMNPFKHPGSFKSQEAIVQYSFDALQSWAYEHRLPRRKDETPLEFSDRFGGTFHDLEPGGNHLANLYSLVTYAAQQPPHAAMKTLQEFWHLMEKSAPSYLGVA